MINIDNFKKSTKSSSRQCNLYTAYCKKFCELIIFDSQIYLKLTFYSSWSFFMLTKNLILPVLQSSKPTAVTLFRQIWSDYTIAPVASLIVWWRCGTFSGSGNFVLWGAISEMQDTSSSEILCCWWRLKLDLRSFYRR